MYTLLALLQDDRLRPIAPSLVPLGGVAVGGADDITAVGRGMEDTVGTCLVASPETLGDAVHSIVYTQWRAEIITRIGLKPFT